MKKLLISSVFLLVANLASAALPPYYQSVNEIKAILDNSEVATKLGSGRAITSIVRSGDKYIVLTDDCALEVKINYLPSEVVGPVPFQLSVGQITCLPR